MRFKSCFRLFPMLAAAALCAQMAPEMKIEPQPTVKVKRGASATVTLKVSLPAGFHANSNKPTDPNLIPLALTWTGGPLPPKDVAIAYPKPQLEEYTFTAGKPISVVTGAFELVTTFKVPATAPVGPAAETGTLHYQACNDRMCFAPKTEHVNVTISVE